MHCAWVMGVSMAMPIAPARAHFIFLMMFALCSRLPVLLSRCHHPHSTYIYERCTGSPCLSKTTSVAVHPAVCDTTHKSTQQARAPRQRQQRGLFEWHGRLMRPQGPRALRTNSGGKVPKKRSKLGVKANRIRGLNPDWHIFRGEGA